MTDVRPTPAQRQILQRLRTDNWRRRTAITVSAGEPLFLGLLRQGWIERRGEGQAAELKLTPAGLEALRAKIPDSPSRIRS
jgi:hypothetical protein